MQDQTVVPIRRKTRVAKLAVAVAVALASGGVSLSAQAEDLNETLKALKKQMEMMQQQIERLEREQRQHERQRAEANKKIDDLKAEQTRQAQADKEIAEEQERQAQVRADMEKRAIVAENVVTAGDTKNSIKLPGTDTSLSWGGYTKLDAIYNSDATEGASKFQNELYIPSTVRVGNTQGEKKEIHFHAKESRLWFKSFTPTDWGALTAYIETDIFNLQSTDSERITNGNTPRLRHAFGSLGNFLAGQTWTTFMPVYALPETNDFGGPAGQIFGRQAQVRWKQPTDWGSWQVALENPESTLSIPAANGGGRADPSDDRVPDIVLRADYKDTWGQASIAGLVRQFRADGTFGGSGGAPTIDVDDSEWGGAISVATKIKVFDRDVIKASAQYGHLGRYQSYNAFNGAEIKDEDEIDTVESLGAFVAYQHWWTPTIRSTWSLGYGEADNNKRRVGDNATESIWSSHLNLLWSPVPNTRFGVEWLHANRELESGQDGKLDRVQFSAKYGF